MLTEAEIIERMALNRPPAWDTLGGKGIVAYDKAQHRITTQWLAETRHCHSVEGHPRGGIVQGGFVTGWLDAAMASACIVRGDFAVAVPSLEIKVAFLLAAHPGIYRAHGWIVRWGRSVSFMEAELRDAEGQLIARASSTAAIRHIKKD